ncbi:hypothetical protein BaRGS_00009650 [Batillaria attramentaria]|uniref:Uncharacterized protein n=1 Tax=Batillaria attramentaria TaxID=370345 RepID=A0ABD0LI65_9CAEN
MHLASVSTVPKSNTLCCDPMGTLAAVTQQEHLLLSPNSNTLCHDLISNGNTFCCECPIGNTFCCVPMATHSAVLNGNTLL